jgi:hypothetical protein
MFIAKYGTNKLCELKSTVMQQQSVLLSQVSQQLKQVFFYVSQFSTNIITGI